VRRSSRLWATSGGLTALLAVFCALPFLVAIYRIDILIFLLINVILAVSYRFLTLAGEYSLGHVVMMGVGAYASALAAKRRHGDMDRTHGRCSVRPRHRKSCRLMRSH